MVGVRGGTVRSSSDHRPAGPRPDDEVVIVFDASEGNQALQGYRGPVYAHTGLIQGTPEQPSEWRYIQGEWGRPDRKVRMRYLGNDRYQLRFRIREFYGLPAGEDFLQMAFVFRDRSGARVARSADETDLYYPPLRTAQTPPEPLTDLPQAQGLGPLQSVRRLADSSLLLSDGTQALRIRRFGPGILNLAYLPTGASQLPPSVSVIAEPSDLIATRSDTLIEVPLTEAVTLRLTPDPLRWALYQGDRLLLDDEAGFRYDPTRRSSGLRLHLQPQERLYGLGSRALPQTGAAIASTSTTAPATATKMAPKTSTSACRTYSPRKATACWSTATAKAISTWAKARPMC